MRIQDPVEVQRVAHLLESAAKAKATAAKEFNDEQVASAASRRDAALSPDETRLLAFQRLGFW